MTDISKYEGTLQNTVDSVFTLGGGVFQAGRNANHCEETEREVAFLAATSSRSSHPYVFTSQQVLALDHFLFSLSLSLSPQIHALITGPFDTPYEGGFFLFLFRCPPDYPIHPPRVKLITTGHNTVRFNPNFYRNGKVCLSILG